MTTPPVVTCYRHPDRRAGITCQRCDRPICPDCMTQGSVGFHCPECVKAAAKSAPSYTARSLPMAQPYVTYVLMAINVAVFVIDLGLGATLTNGRGELWERGVLLAPGIASGEWWRLVSSGFLHYGIIHLAMNMFVLWRIGPQIEKLLGHLQYLALYVASMVAGALGALLLSPEGLTAGASGAVFGLLGAAAAFQVSNKINLWTSGLGGLIAINLAISLIPGVSLGGHLGGIVAGGAVGWIMFELERRRQSPLLGVGIAVGIIAVFVAAAVVAAPMLTDFRIR
jgi:membrane associated rhomboid family serine protease